LQRVVVAIDPAATSGEDADETGIVVAGKGSDGHGYVLADLSGRYSPADWAQRAIAAYRAHQADRIVAGSTMAATWSRRLCAWSIPFTAVHASRGKVVRAEPVAALYEQQRVHHVGMFPELEDQMCGFTTDFDRQRAGYSPDRVDALVWGLSDLLVNPMNSEGIFLLYKQRYEALQARKASL